MKMLKAELAQKINKLKSVVPSKTPNPALQGILVQDGYLTASNLEMTVKAKIKGTEGEAFIIPTRAFDLIRNLPDGEVEIVKGKGNNIVIKAEKIRNTCRSHAPEEFSLNPIDTDGRKEITVKSDLLLGSMRRVSYAVPACASNQVMNSLFLQASGKKLNFVGLDGHVVAWDRVDYEGEFELLLPKATVEKLLVLGLSGDISIRHSRLGAIFEDRDYVVYTRIVEGSYFKYQGMFSSLQYHTTARREELLDALVRAKMCTEEKTPVRFNISGDVLNISIKDQAADYSEALGLQEALPVDFTIGFNAKLVIETLKAFDCENVGIQLQGAKQPMVVESENSDFKAIVLPVMLQAG